MLTQRLIDKNRVYHRVHNNAICCVLCFMTYAIIYALHRDEYILRAKVNFECILGVALQFLSDVEVCCKKSSYIHIVQLQ